VHPGIINTNNTLKLFNLYNELQMFLLKFFFLQKWNFTPKVKKKKVYYSLTHKISSSEKKINTDNRF